MPGLPIAVWTELAGYFAAALVFLAFYMKTMIPLRLIAIASNVAFIAYAAGANLYPVLILHAVLLPLNVLRFLQMRQLIRDVEQASRSGLSMEWLTPFMRRRTYAKGDVVFRRDDPAAELYLILSGSIRLVDLDVRVGPGSVLGEIGVFGPTRERMDTAICESDTALGAIDSDKVWQLYHQNPKFGRYLVTLVIQRLLDDYTRLRDTRLPRGASAPGPLAGGRPIESTLKEEA